MSIQSVVSRTLVMFATLGVGLAPFGLSQELNRPPYFAPGSGDMSRFSLSENTPVDSPVYQLKGKNMNENNNLRPRRISSI